MPVLKAFTAVYRSPPLVMHQVRNRDSAQRTDTHGIAHFDELPEREVGHADPSTVDSLAQWPQDSSLVTVEPIMAEQRRWRHWLMVERCGRQMTSRVVAKTRPPRCPHDAEETPRHRRLRVEERRGPADLERRQLSRFYSRKRAGPSADIRRPH